MHPRVGLQALALLVFVLALVTPHRLKCAMVTLTRIYTRGGDRGQTSLGDGPVAKHDLGSRPTARSTRPMPRSAWRGSTPMREADAMLARIQNDLFDLGADLATPEREGQCRPARDRRPGRAAGARDRRA